MRHRCLLAFVATFSLPLAACGDDGHDHNDHEHEEVQFICTGSEDPLTPGTSKVGESGSLTLAIVEAIPAVHYVQNNELILTVADSDGVLLDGADFTSIVPFTAAHDHGTPVLAKWEATANSGEYRLFDVNYVHRGPWKVDIAVTAGGKSDTFQFIFCIKELPGNPDAG